MPIAKHASPQQAGQCYVQENLHGLTPIQLLIKLYAVAIVSCARRDKARLSRAIVELIAALNFEHRDVALGLFRLYNYCLRLAKKEQFEAVKPILCELRDTWAHAQTAEGA